MSEQPTLKPEAFVSDDASIDVANSDNDANSSAKANSSARKSATPPDEITKESTVSPPRPLAPQPLQPRQVPPQRWQIFPAQRAQAKQIAQATALSPLLAQVLINRGIYTPEQAWEFLDPEALLLPPPIDEFPDLTKSLDLLVEAIEIQQPILICGDYDADGMTSTALLMRSLTYLGAQVSYAIPSRMSEGYGINTRIVEDFHKAGGSLLLTVDNGIAAYEPVLRARDLGLTVIITDHHEVPDDIPPANAILNPKLISEASPYQGVAGVGVAYILAVCLAQRMDKVQDLTATLLGLFTLGTIADLAPLTGVNRRWVKRGLTVLPKSRIPGIQALIEVAGIGDEKALKPEAIGFRLGPRINAVGRIADPQIVIDLLTTDDIGVALQRAMQCEEANQLRQQMCQIIETQAVEWVEAQREKGLLNLNKERVLVVVQPEWHHGVIGIVASRLVERYGVPVFIGTYEDKAKKEIRGSARSIPELNVFEALQFCDDLLGKYGGHRAAGGFSFEANKLRQVKSRLSSFACKHLQPEHLKPLVTADVQAQLEDVTLTLYNQIDRIHPCGIENPNPVFWTANVGVVEQKVIGKDRSHLKLTLAHTAPGSDEKVVMKAIAWRWGTYYPLPRALDIAYKIRLNEWKGKSTVELELVGVRPATVQNPDSGPDSDLDSHSDNGIRSGLNQRDQSSLDQSSKQSDAKRKSDASRKDAIGSDANRKGVVKNAPTEETLSLNLKAPVLDGETKAASKGQPSRPAVPAPSMTTTAQAAKEIALNFQKGLVQPAPADATVVDNTSGLVASKGPVPFPAELSAVGKVQEKQAAQAVAQSSKRASGSALGSGASTADSTAADSAAADSATHVEFYHNKRRYKGTLQGEQADKQLRIENAGGDLLLVEMSDRQGLLYRPDKAPQPVDIADIKYFNLIRAGLSALEVKQKTQMLLRKDELIEEKNALLSEKDRQITTLKAQMSLLEEKITQLSAEQQRQFAELETARKAQEDSIQGQEAHIEALQVQVPQPVSAASSLSPSALKQQVRDAVGDNVWFCLQAASQKDLQAAFKNYQMANTNGPDAHIDDYSDAGVRLSNAVEREVLYPLFKDLHSFLSSKKVTSMGGIPLSITGQPTDQNLGMIPPLLADQWRSFPPGQLSVRSLPEEGVKIIKVQAKGRVSAADRALMTQFLGQWEHPMASCFSQKGRQAASSLDQISKLRNIAIHTESFLYRWQYDLLHQLIAGKEGKGGLLRQIFAL